MGIESTRYITREDAIDRIKEISELFIAAKLVYRVMSVEATREEIYREIEEKGFEQGTDVWSVEEFAGNWTPDEVSDLENWTDEMLGDYMDNSFFRYSMFENYLVKKEE